MASDLCKKAYYLSLENRGNISQAMIGAGYSINTAHTPANLTKTKGWEELMEEHLPDILLAKKHKALLKIPKKVRTFIKGDLKTEYEELDSQAISKGLDMAYKLKGRYAPIKSDVTTQGESLNKTIELSKEYLDLLALRKETI